MRQEDLKKITDIMSGETAIYRGVFMPVSWHGNDFVDDTSGKYYKTLYSLITLTNIDGIRAVVRYDARNCDECGAIMRAVEDAKALNVDERRAREYIFEALETSRVRMSDLRDCGLKFPKSGIVDNRKDMKKAGKEEIASVTRQNIKSGLFVNAAVVCFNKNFYMLYTNRGESVEIARKRFINEASVFFRREQVKEAADSVLKLKDL